MPSYRIPKEAMSSWLPQTHPHGGPRRKWQDLLKRDIKAAGIPEEARWYDVVLHWGQWYAAYKQGLSDYQQTQQQRIGRLLQDMGCDEYGRFSRRKYDKSRHKCAAERQYRLVCELKGAVFSV